MKTKQSFPDFISGVLLSVAALLFVKSAGVDVSWLAVVAPILGLIALYIAVLVFHCVLLALSSVSYVAHTGVSRLSSVRSRIKAKTPEISGV